MSWLSIILSVVVVILLFSIAVLVGVAYALGSFLERFFK